MVCLTDFGNIYLFVFNLKICEHSVEMKVYDFKQFK